MCDLINDSIEETPESPPSSRQSSSNQSNDENENEKKEENEEKEEIRSISAESSPDDISQQSPLPVEATSPDANRRNNQSKEEEKERKTISDGELMDSEKEEIDRKNKKKKRKRSKSPPRNRSRKRRRRLSSSSSRGTFEGFTLQMAGEDELDDAPYKCDECGRGKLYTIKEVAEHEIRAHDARIPCMHCSKDSESVAKLAAHMQYRHPNESVTCHYCKQNFAKKISTTTKDDWENFRKHVYQEVLKKKMYIHASKESRDSDQVALRGVGRCPHGPPVKCKNFPTCPGDRCIYSHGLCRFDRSCQKTACPFDHSNRPRTCMACLNDLKAGRIHGSRSRH